MSGIPTEQKALLLKRPNIVYELTTRPVPQPSPTDVLVRVEAIGLNPADLKLTKFDLTGMFGLSYPAVFGTDGAGVVVDVGKDVVDVKVGDRVAFQGWIGSDKGTMQEYALASGDLVMKLPDSISFTEGSTLPTALATAALGLYVPYSNSPTGKGCLGLKPFWVDGGKGAYKDTPLLVLGGSSSVGQYVIQLAHYQAFSPIITTSSTKHAEYLRSLGADYVVDRYANIADEIHKQYPELKIPYIYDAVHDPITQAEVDLLAPGGTIVSVHNLPKNLNLSGDRKIAFVWGVIHAYIDLGRPMYARLPEFLAEGIIKPSRIEKVDGGLSAVNQALEKLGRGEVSGHKLVVLPPETSNVS